MVIAINNQVYLELIDAKHAQGIFDVAARNRQYLGKWLTWVGRMDDVSFIEKFVNGVLERHAEGLEWSFVIVKNAVVIGRITVHKIDGYNKIGEIGYWIAENEQGQGIVNQSCTQLIKFCFEKLKLNRLEIKCGTDNKESQRIPERLGFTHEGVMQQAELLNGQFINLNLYALLEKTWKMADVVGEI